MSDVLKQLPDGRWVPDEPLGPVGALAGFEFWLRAKGFKRLPALLARWDERGLGR